jgi:hypothetical protein
VKRRTHPGQNDRLEAAFLKAARELQQLFRGFQFAERALERARLIEDVSQILAFNNRKII